MINSAGTGNFTLQFTDIPNANNITAYKINTTNHWIPLNTITTADSVTFEISVDDTRVVFASDTSLRGDLNSDGILAPADAAIALRLAASGDWNPAADVNHDD
jgi:hypothetical protein